MIRWIVFSTLSAGLFYGLYCLTLRRDRWLQLSLWYLLLALGFSIVFPFISLPERVSLASQSVIPSGAYQATLNEIEVSATPASHAIGLTDVYFVGLALCAAYLLFQMVAQTVILVRLQRRHSVYRSSDGFDIPRRASLVLLDDDTAPYSFFNRIVVGTRGLSDDELRCILAHESYHVSGFHSIDLLFSRILCCLAWFNPFAWLMMRELRAVQEFQADAASIGACGREDYLHLLYRQVTGTGYGHITNNFLSINIKKRIVMMNKTKTRFGAWKVLAALPVAAVLLMVGCKPATQNADEAIEVENVVVDDEQPEVYNVVEVDPEFPGGIEALYKYLAENITYPQQAKDSGIQGRVYVTFVVEKDGSITGAKVLRGIGGGCDEEALRVVNAMPKWTPGKQLGEPVRVQFNLPVVFKLK
ncbi:MAG: M56 family metallopeptidase [Bacteroidales bacterium]|nr:M56 family metallopeptidase [Bacteroidales bacterium]